MTMAATIANRIISSSTTARLHWLFDEFQYPTPNAANKTTMLAAIKAGELENER
jgi:hypothetical protein